MTCRMSHMAHGTCARRVGGRLTSSLAGPQVRCVLQGDSELLAR